MKTRSLLATVVALVAVMLFTAPPAGGDTKPKPAEAQRRKGGEAFPPLPLPATPLRRTEKKRPPAPPLLIARIKYGEPRMRVIDGEVVKFLDWNTDEGSIQTLLHEAQQKLTVRYRVDNLSLAEISGDPAQLPIVYLTGHVKFALSGEEKAKLKKYIEAGGFLWGEACCGAAEFGGAFRALAKELFPERPMLRLPLDHAVFHSFEPLKKLVYSKKAAVEQPEGLPVLEGVDLGCRTAILFSPYDLSCGWDNHDHEAGGTDCDFRAVLRDEAKRVGINMISYCLGYHELGRFLASRKVYYDEGKAAGGDFVFGQVLHEGNWDPDPSAAVNLLTALRETTSSKVKYQRRNVRLDSPDLFEFPFLYITGHEGFTLSEIELGNLKRFIDNGGFLFADACCGRQAFADAFRREMARVFPENALERLPREHGVFTSLFKIEKAAVTPRLKAEQPELTFPALEGITIEGGTRVIFSPYDLGNGWEGVDHPFTRGYASEDALKIGVNVIVYSLTH